MKLTLTLLVLTTTAIFGETWMLRNGDAVEMELLKSFEKGGGLTGEFQEKDGGIRLVTEKSLTDADAKRLREFAAVSNNTIPMVDAVIANLRKGIRPTVAEIEKCNDEKRALFRHLFKKYDTENELRFDKDDQADLYILLVKMAVIDFPNHGHLPLKADLAGRVYQELKSRIESSETPFLSFCAIFPSFHQGGDVDQAIAHYRMIHENDPFLAEIAGEWCRTQLMVSPNKEKFMKVTEED